MLFVYIAIFLAAMYGLYYSLSHRPAKTIEEVLPEGFAVSYKIASLIAFDDEQKIFCTAKYAAGFHLTGTYKYSDVMDYQILEDGNPIIGGGLGGAVAGGVLFGGAGAVAGSVIGKKTVGHQTVLQVRIIMKSDDDPVLNFQWAYDSSRANPEQLKLVHQFARKLDKILGRTEAQPND